MKVNPTATSAQNRDVLRAGTLQTHTHKHTWTLSRESLNTAKPLAHAHSHAQTDVRTTNAIHTHIKTHLEKRSHQLKHWHTN